MKRHALLAGRSLMAAALTGAVLYLVSTATVHMRPIWPYFVLLAAFFAGGVLYLVGQDRRGLGPDRTGHTMKDQTAIPEAGPVQSIIGRWRSTTDGTEVPLLMRLAHNNMSHPAYMKRSAQGNPPPSMRSGAVVACYPLGPAPATSEIRARFLTFLNGEQTKNLVETLTSAGDAVWTAWDGHGRMNFGAILGNGQDSAPVAWARLLLPELGMSPNGIDAQCAVLLLHVEPRTADGKPAQAVSIATWRRRFTKALALPSALADFLDNELGLTCAGDPAPQMAVWLNAPHSLTELVDTEGIDSLPGSPPANWFTGYALAVADGQLPDGLAYQWLREMCDNMLHLDGYEPSLVAGNAEQASARLLPMAKAGMRKLEHNQPPGKARTHISGEDSYARAYAEFTEKALADLDTVNTQLSVSAFANQYARQIQTISAEIPEFYAEEFFNLFKDAMVQKARIDVADCERIIEEAKTEAATASAELTARLDAARAIGDQQAQHEVWREREIRQAECQAKIDEASERISIISLRINGCEELASVLDLSFN